MFPALVSAKHAEQLQPGHRPYQHQVKPAIIHFGQRRRTIAAAVIPAVADGRHHIAFLVGFAIHRNPQRMAKPCAGGHPHGEGVGHRPAAAGNPAEARRVVSDIRIKPRRADRRAETKTCVERVQGDRPCLELGIQVKEVFLPAEVAQIIIAAAAGHAADGKRTVAGCGLQHLIEGAVPAAGVQVYPFARCHIAGSQPAGIPAAGCAVDDNRRPLPRGGRTDGGFKPN